MMAPILTALSLRVPPVEDQDPPRARAGAAVATQMSVFASSAGVRSSKQQSATILERRDATSCGSVNRSYPYMYVPSSCAPAVFPRRSAIHKVCGALERIG